MAAGSARSSPSTPSGPAALLPADTLRVSGVIDTATSVVDHPELVAQRLARFVDVLGPDRVVAGADCGSGAFAGNGAIRPTICWLGLGLRSPSKGAALASRPRGVG